MSLRKVLFATLALLISGGGLKAQKLLVGADFETRFDNREYANNDFNESQTLFSARLTPQIGVEWQQKNRLILGVEMLQNFGQYNPQGDRFLSDVKPLMYYRFKTANVQANAGIFNRKELMGDYSSAFFSDSTRFYHNRLSGFLGRYVSTQREKPTSRWPSTGRACTPRPHAKCSASSPPAATRPRADSTSDTPSRCSTSPDRSSTRT